MKNSLRVETFMQDVQQQFYIQLVENSKIYLMNLY